MVTKCANATVLFVLKLIDFHFDKRLITAHIFNIAIFKIVNIYLIFSYDLEQLIIVCFMDLPGQQ